MLADAESQLFTSLFSWIQIVFDNETAKVYVFLKSYVTFLHIIYIEN